MRNQSPSSNPFFKYLFMIVKRILLVAITLFFISAITFSIIDKNIKQCEAYQLNCSYENVSENTFSIITKTFHTYIFDGLLHNSSHLRPHDESDFSSDSFSTSESEVTHD